MPIPGIAVSMISGSRAVTLAGVTLVFLLFFETAQDLVEGLTAEIFVVKGFEFVEVRDVRADGIPGCGGGDGGLSRCLILERRASIRRRCWRSEACLLSSERRTTFSSRRLKIRARVSGGRGCTAICRHHVEEVLGCRSGCDFVALVFEDIIDMVPDEA